MKRIVLFLATNLAVMLVLSIAASVLGVNKFLHANGLNLGMLLVFAAMGLGLALPYALLGLAPGLASLLPRPGLWMERLRQALAWPMYAASAWLVWVLAQLAGPDGVALALRAVDRSRALASAADRPRLRTCSGAACVGLFCG
jgi:thiol:disulfide interchange protein DsbD